MNENLKEQKERTLGSTFDDIKNDRPKALDEHEFIVLTLDGTISCSGAIDELAEMVRRFVVTFCANSEDFLSKAATLYCFKRAFEEANDACMKDLMGEFGRKPEPEKTATELVQ